jgi:uncharacterized membrane protein YfcA
MRGDGGVSGLTQVIVFALVGFAAQLIDGAMGMAFGIVGTTIMLGMGIAPATASASVHAAEVFTTAASGLSHWRVGNVQWRLVAALAVPGSLGGIVGAYVLTSLPSDTVRIAISLYLVAMGLWIIARGTFGKPSKPAAPHWTPVLGLGGGFLDAIGGGGWGPLVTSTLLGQGTVARYTIGSVCLSEFFVTTSISLTFLFTIGLELWPIIAGLVIGGAIAAPIAALAAKHVPERPLLVAVGTVLTLISARRLFL